MAWERVEVGPAAILFGDRTGGVSAPPFATANAGYLGGDVRVCVDENRRRLGAAVGGAAVDPRNWVRIRQVHGSNVLTPEATRRARWVSASEPVEADGAITAAFDVVLVVLTADCGPVALAGRHSAALVHAGWRGTVGGVLHAAVAGLQAVDPGPVQAVIGPLARSCCYEFAPEDITPIAARFGSRVRATTSSGRPALDQPAAIRAALEQAGVAPAAIADVERCTVCDSDCFSHRREGVPGPTGRQATLLTLDAVLARR